MWCMGPKVGMGGEHHRYYKHTKFCQNLRGDLTMTPGLYMVAFGMYIMYQNSRAVQKLKVVAKKQVLQ